MLFTFNPERFLNQELVLINKSRNNRNVYELSSWKELGCLICQSMKVVRSNMYIVQVWKFKSFHHEVATIQGLVNLVCVKNPVLSLYIFENLPYALHYPPPHSPYHWLFCPVIDQHYITGLTLWPRSLLIFGFTHKYEKLTNSSCYIL